MRYLGYTSGPSEIRKLWLMHSVHLMVCQQQRRIRTFLTQPFSVSHFRTAPFGNISGIFLSKTVVTVHALPPRGIATFYLALLLSATQTSVGPNFLFGRQC